MRAVLVLIFLALAGCEDLAAEQAAQAREQAMLEQMTPAQQAQYRLQKQQLAIQQQQLATQQALGGLAIMQSVGAPPQSTQINCTSYAYGYSTETRCN